MSLSGHLTILHFAKCQVRKLVEVCRLENNLWRAPAVTDGRAELEKKKGKGTFRRFKILNKGIGSLNIKYRWTSPSIFVTGVYTNPVKILITVLNIKIFYSGTKWCNSWYVHPILSTFLINCFETVVTPLVTTNNKVTCVMEHHSPFHFINKHSKESNSQSIPRNWLWKGLSTCAPSLRSDPISRTHSRFMLRKMLLFNSSWFQILGQHSECYLNRILNCDGRRGIYFQQKLLSLKSVK